MDYLALKIYIILYFFQGGTSIRLCYNNDRYSKDLDFVMNKNQIFDREFMKYFENIFREKYLISII